MSKFVTLLIAAYVFSSSAAFADFNPGVSISPEKIWRDGHYISVVLKVENGTNNDYESVYVSCGVQNLKGDVVGSSDKHVPNVASHQKAYDTLLVSVSDGENGDAYTADCRVISTE